MVSLKWKIVIGFITYIATTFCLVIYFRVGTNINHDSGLKNRCPKTKLWPPFLFHVDNHYESVGWRNFFIFSVIANSYSNSPDVQQVVFNGWENGRSRSYTCCFLQYDGTVFEPPANETRYYKLVESDINALQVVCRLPNDVTYNQLIGVGLSMDHECDHSTVFHKPLLVQNFRSKKPTFAVVGKTIYGSKHPGQLIEWVEFHKLLGANRIYLYYYDDLNNAALDVVRYYQHDIIFQGIPVRQVPLTGDFPRNFGTADNPNTYQDEQVINFDAQERVLPYTYFGLIDTDEFITPVLAATFIDMMKRNLARRPNMACFTMLTELYMLSWQPLNATSDLMLLRYSWHTKAVSDRVKRLYVTDRVQPGTVWVHNGHPKPGFTSGMADGVTLKHFRHCRDEWMHVEPGHSVPLCDKFPRRRDKSMYKIGKMIRPRVQKVKQSIGIT